MVQHPIADLRDSSGRVILTLAWPQDILCDDRGVFVGYTMPFIQNGVEICTVARGCDMPKAKTMFPNYDWMFNLQVAINLSKAVAYLHSNNCIVGDLNCKNIMVSPDGLITMLDNDSFDLLDTVSGIHFRCCAGTQDYLAPELQGRNLRSAGAVFSVHSDNFALAIHIFQLLMNNYHPFTGKNLVVIQNSTSVNQRLDHLVNGKCPFIHNYSDLTIPIGAPYLSEMVTPQLVQDFYRTFDYNAGNIQERIKLRTTAAQWVTDLQQYMNQFYTPGQAYRCSNNQKHYYLRQAGKCGLCAAEERLTNFRSTEACAAEAYAHSHTPCVHICTAVRSEIQFLVRMVLAGDRFGLFLYSPYQQESFFLQQEQVQYHGVNLLHIQQRQPEQPYPQLDPCNLYNAGVLQLLRAGAGQCERLSGHSLRRV